MLKTPFFFLSVVIQCKLLPLIFAFGDFVFPYLSRRSSSSANMVRGLMENPRASKNTAEMNCIP